MTRSLRVFALIALAVVGRMTPTAAATAAGQAAALREMIRGSSRDYTFMWWAHGWRGRKVRCVQTSAYALALDVEKVRITHFGPIQTPLPYTAAVGRSNGVVFGLPAARLALSVVVGNAAYICRSGDRPRLIESGRFLQRSDLRLRFVSKEGAALPADCRLEMVAWPERLAFILVVSPRRELKAAAATIRFNGEAASTPKANWKRGSVQAVALAAFEKQASSAQNQLSLQAWTLPDAKALSVEYDDARGWHKVEVPPIRPFVRDTASLQRIRLRLKNPADQPRALRINFANEGSVPGIAGLVPLLRDSEGNPLPIPVQISKNWHRKQGQTLLYQGPWLHAITRLWVPARFVGELEFCIARNFWGAAPVASHAQLCLIGWGGDQLWDQAAIGSWGESICYDPDVGLGRSVIDDMRPLMVTQMKTRNGKWGWSNNVGGGDFLVYFDEANRKQFLTRMRAAYLSQGPNLTDVIYSGISADGNIAAALRVMTPRCDDLNRAYHHFRYDVLKPTRFRRLAFYQLGADRYNDHQFRKLARGNEKGLLEEWPAVWGGRKYRRKDIPCPGAAPWFSLHEAISKDAQGGAWANRGLVIRSWKARLGGRDCPPVAASFGTENHVPSCNLELVPPAQVTELLPGDFVEAAVELLVLPQFAKDYYGPNQQLRADLKKNGNTWRPVWRQARDGSLRTTVFRGKLVQSCPLVIAVGPEQKAEFSIIGGVGYAPIIFTGLDDYKGWTLCQAVDGEWSAVDQSVFGNDFWQACPTADGRFSITFNVRLDARCGSQRFRLIRRAPVRCGGAETLQHAERDAEMWK